MQAHKLTVIVFSLGVALAFGTPAKAADLPQSGSIKLHTGWKAVGETVQVGENHVLGSGNFWGPSTKPVAGHSTRASQSAPTRSN